MAKLCFVVHRYPPYAGGSEYYVQAMAEECLRRGHDVTVFTGEHEGDQNGVKVTGDVEIFRHQTFDLVIVHGGDVAVQNWILMHGEAIVRSPILYMIILPTDSFVGQFAMNNAKYIGWSTQEDWKHIVKYGVQNRAKYIRHGIPAPVEETRFPKDDWFRLNYEIETPWYFLSAGGYWPNKGMHELADLFREAFKDRTDTTLVFTGYQNMDQAPKDSEYVRSYLIEDRRDVMRGIAGSDLYIMNSTQEGFGLVLLEAMLNKTPWAARHIAGAIELQQYGFTYTKPTELFEYMIDFATIPDDLFKLEAGANYVMEHRLIKNTVDDIEAIWK